MVQEEFRALYNNSLLLAIQGYLLEFCIWELYFHQKVLTFSSGWVKTAHAEEHIFWSYALLIHHLKFGPLSHLMLIQWKFLDLIFFPNLILFFCRFFLLFVVKFLSLVNGLFNIHVWCCLLLLCLPCVRTRVENTPGLILGFFFFGAAE